MQIDLFALEVLADLAQVEGGPGKTVQPGGNQSVPLPDVV
jgi:hypothetical protein